KSHKTSLLDPSQQQVTFFLVFRITSFHKLASLYRVEELNQDLSPFLFLLFQPSLHLTKRSEEHTSELQSRFDLVCRLLLEKKKCYINRYEVGVLFTTHKSKYIRDSP